MAAYLIADIDVREPERYKAYVESVPVLIAKHGGTYRVRGGEATTLEGEWSPARLIVLEFPDRAAALAFYNDPEYAPFKTLRQSVTDTQLVLAEGHG